ncbi:MAG TPA: MerR family transcriptional regulator [Ignavibacteria bacterium]|nr:MerR family transcriptional regulator [Ignavibacteria bacterium]
MNITYPDNEPLFTISTAARLLRISIQTLRLYEKEGLIVTFKDKSSKRRFYSKMDIDRINSIRNTINVEKISISGIRTLLSLIPCWKLKKCNKSSEQCIVFKEGSKPCWMVKDESKECYNCDCRSCKVYLSFADCSNFKEKIY